MNKQRIVMLFLALFTILNLNAQRQHPTQEGMSEDLKTALNLTEEQRTALEELEAVTLRELEPLRTEKRANREAIKTVLEDHRSGLEAILTDEQLQQMRTLRQAEGHRRAERHRDQNREMRRELKDYRTTNIDPVMDAQRAKLENALSNEEKATIATIRLQLEDAKRQARSEQVDRQHEGRRQHDAKPGHGRRHQRGNAMREQHPEAYAQLEAIVERHDATINNLFEEVAPQAQQWKTEQEAIKAKYAPADRPAREARQPNEERAARREMGKKVAFLLRA